MCGICGIASLDPHRVVDPRIVESMADAIRHRGPDDEGHYVSPQAVLGHRRLSIIDLNTGHQPITNEDGSVWIVFNGEIYNYRELRRDLLQRGHTLRTQSDTEVIVHLYEEYGEKCLDKLRGMFAFAIWDQTQRSLFLARDRVGIKPLYYALADGQLIFGSEIKALLRHPGLQARVNHKALDGFLMHLYGVGEDTMLQGVHRLLPGHYLIAKDGRHTIRQYWDLQFPQQTREGTEEEIAEQLIELLKDTVRDHMISDVPVGVLLSGGVDSTAMLSFAVDETPQAVKTFTVGFSEPGLVDERPFAQLAARRFGSEHHEITISADDFLSFMPRYVWHMEEPVCEPPAVALYYVTELARRHVKVLLSGEGGDEAFAGYQNYRNLVWLERLKALGGFVSKPAASSFDLLGQLTGRARWRKFAHVMRNDLASYYWSRTAGPLSVFAEMKASLYSGALRDALRGEPNGFVQSLFARVADQPPLHQMLYVDSKTWLPDDLLIKADKMTMATSVELRVPLLDHRVLEFAAALPPAMKVNGFRTKHILKTALARRVPGEILRRKKTGFPVPYERWLRKDHQGYVIEVLTERRSRDRGYFDDRSIRALITKWKQGAPLSAEIFALLALELWHRAFVDKDIQPSPRKASVAEVA